MTREQNKSFATKLLDEVEAAREAGGDVSDELYRRVGKLMREVAGKPSMDRAVLAGLERLRHEEEQVDIDFDFTNAEPALYLYIEELIRAGRFPRARSLIYKLGHIEAGINPWLHIAYTTRLPRDIQMVRSLLKELVGSNPFEAIRELAHLSLLSGDARDLELAREQIRRKFKSDEPLYLWLHVAACSDKCEDLKKIIALMNAEKSDRETRQYQEDELMGVLVRWPNYGEALQCAHEIADERRRQRAVRAVQRYWPEPRRTAEDVLAGLRRNRAHESNE